MKLAGELDMLKLLLLLPRDAPPLGDDTTILSFDPFLPNILPTTPNPFIFALGVVGW